MKEEAIRQEERGKCADLLDACADDMVAGMRRPQAIRSLRALARLLRGKPAELPADMREAIEQSIDDTVALKTMLERRIADLERGGT